MTEFFQVMALPFLACLILTGIHAYLGFHVIERQVIFVDLALAQIAALGGGVAMVFGCDFNSTLSYGMSLAFTMIGAFVFSLTRFLPAGPADQKQRVPQEAAIGIAYAVSAALLILVLSRSGEGDEHIRRALTGNILLVNSRDVAAMAALYSLVGVIHFLFRRPFFLISQSPEKALKEGINIRLWDFLFYALFGIVVTSSVKIAGVLLVFAFLVVPPVCAMLFADKPASRLLLGWGVGSGASVVGMAVSYYMDFPTGASVVCVFGFFLIILSGLKKIVI